MRTSARNAIRTTLGLTILAALAIILLSAAPASAQVTKIESCGFTIDLPGKYLISTDLTCNGGVGITIMSDDVELNGAHHVLRAGMEDTTGIGILVQMRTGVVINNVQVQHFDTGIFLDNASDVAVKSFIAEDNDTGVFVQHGSDIFLRTAAVGNAIAGIVLVDSDNITLQDCVAQENGDIGMSLIDTSNSIIHAGSYSTNGNFGMFVDQDSHDNTITANAVHDNGGIGIMLEGDDNFLQANHRIEGNDIGIVVSSGATGNELLSNTARNNTSLDVADLNNPLVPPCPNTWKHNNFVTDNEGNGSKSGCVQ